LYGKEDTAMATLFTSFRSSSMPKRLLRYCLSKLELLDAEALDIDNLDLAFGRNTVFEFRDVGIKIKVSQRLRTHGEVLSGWLS
jgi:autophagy-related protein 2